MKSDRQMSGRRDRCVSGPHETEKDGETVLVWRCEICGTESESPRLKESCWNCDGEWGWLP